MPNYYIFSDEAGDFTFNRKDNVSKYFMIVTTVTKDWKSPTIGLQRLRKDLISEGHEVDDYFHATTDAQAVRDRVYKEILKYDFTVQATICEKSKAQPQVTRSRARFYKVPWYYHCSIGIAPRLKSADNVFLTAASLGNKKKEKDTYINALLDVKQQSFPKTPSYMDFRPCSNDPCLQLTDYCAWAIQRKWELNDERSYEYIKDRITREYDLWSSGTKHYY